MTEMITISRDEYEALTQAREDLQDVRAYDAAMISREEGLPHELMGRLIEGEHPVRVFRDWRGLSAAELGRRAGIHRVQVHEIETGKKVGSVATVKSLAEALGVSVDELV